MHYSEQLNLLVTQNVSKQWDFVIDSLVMVLNETLPFQQRIEFFEKMGFHASLLVDICPSMTLAELNKQLNIFWSQRQWGRCDIYEKQESLVIEHFVSPLSALLQPTYASYGDAFLIAMYSNWLSQASSPYQGNIQKMDMQEVDNTIVKLSYQVV